MSRGQGACHHSAVTVNTTGVQLFDCEDRVSVVSHVQAVKAAKRKEDVAVCVVKLLPSCPAPDSESQYLLVQRPEKGLLAGTSVLPPLSCICLLLYSNWMY